MFCVSTNWEDIHGSSKVARSNIGLGDLWLAKDNDKIIFECNYKELNQN